MALTEAQKVDIRRFLGYSGRVVAEYSLLEGAMNNLIAEAETRVGTFLTDLGTIETTLRSSWSRQKVVKAEEITLAGRDEIVALRSEGNRLVDNLANILGVRVQTYPFSNASSSGGVFLRG